LNVNGTEIEDTFAEAFGMSFARLIVTAHDAYWLDAALREFCGDSSSVIACDAEIGIECRIDPASTPDGRPGASVLVFAFSHESLVQAVPRRAGQSLMTAATSAVYDGLPDAEKRIPLGKHLRFFGDGYQRSKRIGGLRYWRIPVMDGEFTVIDDIGAARGIAGGNIILQGRSPQVALDAARRASEAVAAAPGVTAPFPGGVVRSGSKVGSRYQGLKASTSDGFCPTLRGRVPSKLHDDAHCAYEIVIDGIDEQSVSRAMRDAVLAASGPGIVRISAGNYGGNLGKYRFPLRSLFPS